MPGESKSTAQVARSHYLQRAYDTQDRWISYWRQLDRVLSFSPHTVLEVGPGNGTVSDALRKRGISVTTVDIAQDLNPSTVASVEAPPFVNGAFDVVLAAEVLEHLPFENLPGAVREIHRVARRGAVISLPHAGVVFSLTFKFPLIAGQNFIWKLPPFWQTHVFNGEHYWELGKRGYPVKKIKKLIISSGFSIRSSGLLAGDPSHYFFLLWIKFDNRHEN